MARNDYMCRECGTFADMREYAPQCHVCGKAMEVSFVGWNTIHSPSGASTQQYAHQGRWSPEMKRHFTDRESYEQEKKEKGYIERSDISYNSYSRIGQQPPQPDESRTRKRHERAARFGNLRISPENKERALKDLRAGKI